MDKIDKLRNAVSKGDRISFIHSIHDFSEEDIIRFTEQEFEEIQECCTKMNLNGVVEFFDFLLREWAQAYENSEIERIKDNLLIARFYLTIFLRLYSEYFAIAAIDLGTVQQKLADLGIEPEKILSNL